MPQGSRLGPVSFIVMIDDLRADCEVHKFVDDTTLTELITPSYSPSNMSEDLRTSMKKSVSCRAVWRWAIFQSKLRG